MPHKKGHRPPITTARLKRPAQVGAMRLSAHWIFPAHPTGHGLGEFAGRFLCNIATRPRRLGC